MGVSPSAVKAILVTHDHNDHISALRVLCKKLRVPIYASCETLEGIAGICELPEHTELVEMSSPAEIAGMYITPFDTPHDVAHSIGFRLEAGERTVGYATDLGNVTADVWQGIVGSDPVVLESNFEDSMLAVSSYPYFLKQRIRSDRGHLSNADCASTLVRLAQSGSTRFILGHLSQENNSPSVALQAAHMALGAAGMCENRDYILQVARRLLPSEPVML